MSSFFWKTLKLSPVFLSATLLLANSCLAESIAPSRELAPNSSTPAASQRTGSIEPLISAQMLAQNAPSVPAKSASEAQVAEVNQSSSTSPQVADKSAFSATSQTSSELQQINQYNQAPSASSTNTELQQIDQYNQAPTTPIAQVTSVSQLSDVQPTDWALLALQSLVERYGCIAGYPDGTYRGNRAITRYEFAAGLNACLDRVNELIAAGTSDLVRKEDLATLQRLQAEFAAELTTLRGRVNNLEARTAQLEANQFSTTTKLAGEVIFAASGVGNSNGGSRAAISGRPRSSAGNIRDNEVFNDRVRLSLNTSFTSQDLLRIRLQPENITPFDTRVTGTNMTRLGFDGDQGNSTLVDQLFYRFPIGKQVIFQFDATSDEPLQERGFNVFSPFAHSGTGAISRYGRLSPIYRQGVFGQSGSVTLAVNPQGPIGLNLAYLAPTSNDPSRGFGIVNGDYSAVAQLNLNPVKELNLGLTYAHTYQNGDRSLNGTQNSVQLFSSTDSSLANAPFGNVPTSANNYGVEASIRPSSQVTVFGWGGYTQAIAERSPRFSPTVNGTTLTGPSGSKADIWYFAAGLAFPDLGKQGSLLGFLFGESPRLTANSSVREVAFGNRQRVDNGVSYHAEAFYRYRLTDNIDITPGVLIIFNPENNDRNSTDYVGTLRTTFRF